MMLKNNHIIIIVNTRNIGVVIHDDSFKNTQLKWNSPKYIDNTGEIRSKLYQNK